MKKSMLALSALAFALVATQPVYAQGEKPMPNATTTKSRTEVKSETAAAQKAGTMPGGECDFKALDGKVSKRTRAEVQAEADALRKAGKPPYGECSN
jgi:hypothetical protein